jgi:hypothetical protein
MEIFYYKNFTYTVDEYSEGGYTFDVYTGLVSLSDVDEAEPYDGGIIDSEDKDDAIEAARDIINDVIYNNEQYMDVA